MITNLGVYYEGLILVQQELNSVVTQMGIDLRAPTPMTLYSQRDARWANLPYSTAPTTFERAGCYVVCVAMINSLTGSLDDPPTIAAALQRAGCFEGAFLTRPHQIPAACPGLEYRGTYRWHDTAADMDRVWQELEEGPTILEVDFKPGGTFNQHFIVAESYNEETGGIQICDPWDGTRKELPSSYSPVLGGWDLKRAIYGMRCLRVTRD
jgi:hypothetical protein